jgi:hypothetical protein
MNASSRPVRRAQLPDEAEAEIIDFQKRRLTGSVMLCFSQGKVLGVKAEHNLKVGACKPAT